MLNILATSSILKNKNKQETDEFARLHLDCFVVAVAVNAAVAELVQPKLLAVAAQYQADKASCK